MRIHSALAIAALLSLATIADAQDKQWVYVGTYTNAKTGSKGIYRFDFDSATGKLTPAELAAEAVNPSFLAIHPNGKYLFAVDEIWTGKPGSELSKRQGAMPTAPGIRGGSVSSYNIDPKTGMLSHIFMYPLSGAELCHISLDKTGNCVLAAAYASGRVTTFVVDEDGKVANFGSTIGFEGKGPNPKRQDGSHAHSVTVDPANRFAVICDLGLDQVNVLPFNGKNANFERGGAKYKTAPGAGPRHFDFHPDGKHAFVINELNSTLSLLNYDPEKGVLTDKQTVSTLPPGFTGENWPAEVVVHPSGKFVYGSNRGHNSIVAFAIDPDGKLKLIGHQGDGVKTPRNFNIDQTGQWMIVANQDANNLVVFKIDQDTGALTPTGIKADVGGPVCVKFMAAPK